MDPLAYTKADAAKAIGVGLRTLEREIAEGRIRVTRVRNKPVIRRADLEAYLERLAAPSERVTPIRRPKAMRRSAPVATEGFRSAFPEFAQQEGGR
jgi:excisionase family DNA binding protein